MTRAELREKVARALCAVALETRGISDAEARAIEDRRWGGWAEDADAALAAIRDEVPYALTIADGCRRLAERSVGMPALESGWNGTASLLRALAEDAADG